MKSSGKFSYNVIMGAFAMATVLGLTACGNEKEEDGGTFITVNKDGSIQSEIVESFGEERYDKDELQSVILGELAVYNKKSENGITVEKVDMDGDNVVVKMTYGGSGDYAAFNKVNFYAGDAAGAEAAGFELNVVLSGVKDPNETVGKSDILAMENAGILITDIDESIVLGGKALYVSEGVETFSNGKAVRRLGEDKKLMYVIYSMK